MTDFTASNYSTILRGSHSCESRNEDGKDMKVNLLEYEGGVRK